MAKTKKSRKSDDDVLKELKEIHGAYATIGSHMPKELDVKIVGAQVARFENSITDAKTSRTTWKQAVIVKASDRKGSLKLIKRIRRSTEGVYGDDAGELELVGGKRISTRKRPVRKSKTQIAIDLPQQPVLDEAVKKAS